MTRKTKIEKVEDLINKIDTLIPHKQRNTESKSCSLVYVKKQKTQLAPQFSQQPNYTKEGGKTSETLSFSIETYRVNKTIFLFFLKSFFNSKTQYYVIQLCKSDFTTIKSKNLNPNL